MQIQSQLLQSLRLYQGAHPRQTALELQLEVSLHKPQRRSITTSGHHSPLTPTLNVISMVPLLLQLPPDLNSHVPRNPLLRIGLLHPLPTPP